ncbi:hypothetical protein OBBRIDRAFT_890636 [Obba rivulosa]|uniref:Uncharacterized protein n=1 Tax=Obba rivulosa TaxID=1052685 RepID=A0A8E2AT58_9APHY|nr:hypothetical protein OBBRIDRAFT_890636 [Obba rivulosa]
MIPLIPTLALAFISFISSVFVILRIVIPILPPHPLSRRVSPSEFGLPNFRSLSPADKSHIWLASCDFVALAVFIWQVIAEYLSNGQDYAVAQDPASAIRLWIALTLRQTCLLMVAALTLLHVRLGKPVAYGSKHWMLWAPALLLVCTSTSLAGVLAGSGVSTYFIGFVAYSSTLAALSSVAFACLVGTLVIIRRNLAALNDIRDPWPPAKQIEEKPRPSFATDDVEALKDGSSWITSRASSRHDSISAFSFSTHQTHHSAKPSNASARIMTQQAALASVPSIPAKSSFWFNPATPYGGHGRESPVPPVPPLPAPYRPSSPTSNEINDDPDPFKRHEQVPRMGSQTSWLSEPSIYQPTLSAWSFPVSRAGSTPSSSTPRAETALLPSTAYSRPITPAMASTEVLGGYGYAPEVVQAEKGTGALTPALTNDLDVSVYRAIGWLISIWVPLALSLPYMFTVSPNQPFASTAVSILLVLSVTLSSPILAANILFRSPLPIPSGLFDSYSEPPSIVNRAPSPQSTIPSFKFSHEYKRSGSITVVEGRRSGDVWLSNGDAVDGKSKIGRALGLLQPAPRLAVLPTNVPVEDAELTPPLPMQTEDHSKSLPPTPRSETSAELGRRVVRMASQASSYSTASEHFATQIMVAQRHYSALATTMVLPPSPERGASMDHANVGIAVSGVEPSPPAGSRYSQHLRARSVSSVTGSITGVGSRFPVSPPPASPLPPTPPSVRERKARMLSHRKSQSQSSLSIGFSFGAVGGEDMAEIDALSAHVLPLLVPGLKVGSDVRVRDDWDWGSRPSTVSKGSSEKKLRGNDKGSKRSKALPQELGGLSTDFSSPDMHSTPPIRNAAPREKKISTHKRHHFSLPSLSLGKDGLHALSTWRNDLNRAVENKLAPYSAATTGETRQNPRIASCGGELAPNVAAHLNAVTEEDELLRPKSPAADNRMEHLAVQSAENVYLAPSMHTQTNTARNSLATLITALEQERLPLPSAASEITLFDFNPEEDGPLAESTPHESKTHAKPKSHHVPPVPALPASERRSSIIYIKSNENAAPQPQPQPPRKSSLSPKNIAQWSSRAVRPLVPKSRSKAPKIASPPAGGLRPLSLLQDRDVNADVRPLAIGRKEKQKQKQKVVNDENADPNTGGKRGLKPLTLARSETTKQRALLRKDEVLPDVVVRPPSESQYAGYGYTFR